MRRPTHFARSDQIIMFLSFQNIHRLEMRKFVLILRCVHLLFKGEIMIFNCMHRCLR